MEKEIFDSYNKDKYLESLDEYEDRTINNIKRTIKQAAEYEKLKQKCLYDWNIEEICAYYKTLNSASISYLRSVNSILSQYTMWCLKNGIVKDSLNHFKEITLEMYKNCINNQRVKNQIIKRNDLITNINVLLSNPSDKFLMLAIFEGLKGSNFDELTNLNTDSFFKKGDVLYVKTNNRIIEISERLYNYAIEASERYTYDGLGELGSQQNGKAIKLCDNIGISIIKDYTNVKSQDDFRRGRRIYIRFKKLCERFELSGKMNVKDLYESGRIDYITKIANAKGISKKEVLKNESELIYKKYTEKYNYPEYVMKYADYLTD